MNSIFRIDVISDSSFSTFPKPAIIIGLDWKVLIAVAIIALAIALATYFLRRRKTALIPVKVVFSNSSSIECKILRNDQNIYIAHRIFIELVTRKAAHPIDFENDVILDIYASWYKLFGIIRDEIKSVPGEVLMNIKSTCELTNVSIEILNKALRPHLTKYYARFTQWYDSIKDKHENKNLAPQELQKMYPQYDALKSDMENVSTILQAYSCQLQKIFKGSIHI